LDEAGPYWALALQYVPADRMFPTEFGASFASHLNLIAANTELTPDLAEVDEPSQIPWTCDVLERVPAAPAALARTTR
jgi:phospholipase C